MDPCPYIRILVGNLAIKFPKGAKPVASSSAIHPTTTPCYCKIRLGDFTAQESSVAVFNDDQHEEEEGVTRQPSSSVLAACFTLGKKQVEAAVNHSSDSVGSSKYCLVIEIYIGGDAPACGLWGTKGKLLGKVRVPLCWVEMSKLLQGENVYPRGFSMHNGWVGVGAEAQLKLKIRAELDPRYVFEFGGEPELSPHVFQVQGNSKKQNKQAVFTCKFSLRNPGDRALGTKLSLTESSTPRKWLSALASDKDQASKERKGWTVTIHDLSGSPVAMASMVTPFVPSPGSDRVSQSSPGAWLILQPSYGTWKPWGRLEAWRDRSNSVVYRFDLSNDTGIADPATSTLASSTISAKHGGIFSIDTTNTVTSPLTSPHGSFDLGSASPLTHFAFKGFVMSSTVEATGKPSRPVVEIGSQHVSCIEDAAAFVALAAALDLSIDACTLFTSKLRKELRQQINGSLAV